MVVVKIGIAVVCGLLGLVFLFVPRSRPLFSRVVMFASFWMIAAFALGGVFISSGCDNNRADIQEEAPAYGQEGEGGGAHSFSVCVVPSDFEQSFSDDLFVLSLHFVVKPWERRYERGGAPEYFLQMVRKSQTEWCAVYSEGWGPNFEPQRFLPVFILNTEGENPPIPSVVPRLTRIRVRAVSADYIYRIGDEGIRVLEHVIERDTSGNFSFAFVPDLPSVWIPKEQKTVISIGRYGPQTPSLVPLSGH